MKTAFDIREFQEARRVSKNSMIRAWGRTGFLSRKLSPSPGMMVGALISKGKKKLSCACNRDGIITFRDEGNHALIIPRHAEIQAAQQAGIENLKGATIWVWRETSDGIPGLARPCERHCMPFLKLAGIKRVIYTASNHPYFREEKI